MRRVALFGLVVGCSPMVDSGGEKGSTGGPGSTTSTTTTTTTTTTTATTTTTTTSGTAGESSTGWGESGYEDDGAGTGCAFTCPNPPGGGGATSCDPSDADSCPEGEKCMPWANDGGNLWNATRCTPIDPDSAAVGTDCMAEGSGVSGVDNCAAGHMCWHVDDETNAGVCHQFCSAVPGEPTCPDGHVCSEPYGFLLPLCVLICDPLAPACPKGDGCYQAGSSYGCLPTLRPVARQWEPCTYRTQCAPGQVCVSSDILEVCEDEACCASFCDADGIGCPNCTPFLEGAPAPRVGFCP